MIRLVDNTRTIAKLTGWALILMAIIAAFAFGFAYSKIYDTNNLALLEANLRGNLQLYTFMLVGISLIILLDIFVSFTLYLFFKNDHKKLAFISFILRLLYTLIFLFATFHLFDNLSKVNNNIPEIKENFNAFQKVWTIGLIIFGIHLLIVGVLMNLHKQIPKTLWSLAILAGLSYILVHVLKITSYLSAELIKSIEQVLVFPMAFGEIGLAIWLIIKGGKIKKIIA